MTRYSTCTQKGIPCTCDDCVKDLFLVVRHMSTNLTLLMEIVRELNEKISVLSAEIVFPKERRT